MNNTEIIEFLNNLQSQDFVDELSKKQKIGNYHWLTERPNDFDEKTMGFIYCTVIFNHNLEKNIYVGKAQDWSGKYKGSVKTHKELYHKSMRDNEWAIFILAIDTNKQIKNMEAVILQTTDATKNPSYFNENNAGSKELNASRAFDNIESNLAKNQYPKEKWDKETIKAWDTFQVRNDASINSDSLTDTKRVTAIRNEINSSSGKYIDEYFTGVLVLQDYAGPGKPIRIGSNHTVEAAQTSVFISKLDVIFIPKKDWAPLTKWHIRLLGMEDNKYDASSLKKSNDPKEIVDICADAVINNNLGLKGHLHGDIEVILDGLCIGTFEYTHYKTQIKKEVERRAQDNRKLKFRKYTPTELDTEAVGKRGEHVHAIWLNTTIFAGRMQCWDKLLAELDNPDARAKKNWKIDFVHDTEGAVDTWNNTYYAQVKARTDLLSELTDIKFTIIVKDHTMNVIEVEDSK